MPRNKTLLALAPLRRISQQVTRLRVSKPALVVLQSHLISHLKERANTIVAFSHHAGRTTVIARDVLIK
jgi:histone H3/H4